MMTTKKTAFITGANKGVGLATAKQLAQLDYQVYLGSRDKSNGQKAVEELRELGLTNVDLIQIDVTDEESIIKAKLELESKMDRLDVLVNNAGIGGTYPQNASEISIDNLRTVFETNFFGVIQVTQHFLELLKKSGEPRIVNVTSGLGSLTNHSDPNAPYYDSFKYLKMMAYCSSKTSLNAFTVMLADEFKDTAFKINSVSPGFASTSLNNFTGTHSPDEVINAIIKYATLDQTGPTGKFVGEEGEVAW
ncbi:SDR family oxidoreductase [Dyadobacter sp. CY326]|uniref:SDR family oxidoreductase n=1 Tax=Dyadobacter sp. CY326 TaxID=2907300 RepID=UPI001F2A335F|nr:SDR family oxidoreductase [Dyadobacter sp. CY326]MCE7065237.1 SDR family oxidoreductase [Dyadobacter sp. CY326]